MKRYVGLFNIGSGEKLQRQIDTYFVTIFDNDLRMVVKSRE